MADADTATRNLILRLASHPVSVRVDKHARGEMLSWNLRVDDVCGAICDCITAGERVKATTVKKHPQEIVGLPAYEIWPRSANQRFYVRLTIYQSDKETLLLISVHPG
jgi:hypothetical protein